MAISTPAGVNNIKGTQIICLFAELHYNAIEPFIEC